LTQRLGPIEEASARLVFALLSFHTVVVDEEAPAKGTSTGMGGAYVLTDFVGMYATSGYNARLSKVRDHYAPSGYRRHLKWYNNTDRGAHTSRQKRPGRMWHAAALAI
jgi:hypothetical protein